MKGFFINTIIPYITKGTIHLIVVADKISASINPLSFTNIPDAQNIPAIMLNINPIK